MTDNKVAKLANNCVSCVTKPCQIGCPLNNDITGFIKEIKNKNYEAAFKILSDTSVMMPVCGRICPHTKQCEGVCVKGISYKSVHIGMLEAFIGDMWLKKHWQISSPIKTNKKVAVIGAGPAGLTCAAFLRKNGIGVTIYEKHDYLGGLLIHGIPDFRLPRIIVNKVTNNIINLGIDVKYNHTLGKNISLNELRQKYDAIFLGIGANVSNKLGVVGENLKNVYGANELLEYKPKINYKNKTFIIIGGGNTAMDVARTIKRKGAHAIVVYHKESSLMPALKNEVKDAKNEGVEFIFSTNITKIIGRNKVSKVELNKKEKVFEIPCDYVIKAIGSHPDTIIKRLKLEKNGEDIKIDSEGRTNIPKVFAGGDVAGGKATVSWASRAGRNAAYAIIKYLKD